MRKAGRRYRYHVSRPLITGVADDTPGAWRIPAPQLEGLIATETARILAEQHAVATALENAGVAAENIPAALSTAARFRDDLGTDARVAEAVNSIIDRVDLSPNRLRLTLALGALVSADLAKEAAPLVRDIPLRFARRGVELKLVIAGPSLGPATADPVLFKELRRAHRCFDALVSGRVETVAELARIEGVSDRYVSSLLPLAFLAPDIVEAIASGPQPAGLTAHRLIRSMDLPIAWAAQKQLVGLA